MPQPVDIEFEIAGLEIERDDIRRDMRFGQWVTLGALATIYGFGPSWLGYLSKDATVSMMVGLGVLVGVFDKMNRHRLTQLHDRIIDFRLKHEEAATIPAHKFARATYVRLMEVWEEILPEERKVAVKMEQERVLWESDET